MHKCRNAEKNNGHFWIKKFSVDVNFDFIQQKIFMKQEYLTKFGYFSFKRTQKVT